MRAECFSQWSCLLRYLIPSGGFNHFHQFFMFTVVWRRFPCSTHFSHLLKSPVIVGMSWPGRKTLLGKGRKKCRYTKELDYRAPNSWVPNSNCNGFWPKMLCLGFDGFGVPRWKDRNPWNVVRQKSHVVEDFETSNTSEVVSAQSSRDVVALRSAVMRASRAGAHGRNRSSGPPKSPLQRDFPWFDEPKEPSV